MSTTQSCVFKNPSDLSRTMDVERCGSPASTIISKDWTALHWFRKGLRFHDNPALSESIKLSQTCKCIYIIDPSTINGDSSDEINKWRFLLESLQDLDNTLRKYNSRLYVLRGQPTFILPILFKNWHVNILSMEEDPTPYGTQRDQAIGSLANEHGVCMIKRTSHTLYNTASLVELCESRGSKSLQQFAVIFKGVGPPELPLETVELNLLTIHDGPLELEAQYSVPSLEDLGLRPNSADSIVWHGGETEALRRLSYNLERRAWVACFDQPKMNAASLKASPGGLGPYLSFGCLSPRLLYWKMAQLYRQVHPNCEVPLSLHGQLILREYYYVRAVIGSNKKKLNQICLQMPWKKSDAEVLKQVYKARTGFPWIDAVMKQLITEGCTHGLAKHSLISFITYGQLFYSSQEAASLLDYYCLDGDISTNSGLSEMLTGGALTRRSALKLESPILTGKKFDPDGDFIRQYLPVLRSYPSVYVYEPWLASLDIQKQAGCIIGQDYPAPMCDHQLTLHSNKLQLQQFIISHQERHGDGKRKSGFNQNQAGSQGQSNRSRKKY